MKPSDQSSIMLLILFLLLLGGGVALLHGATIGEHPFRVLIAVLLLIGAAAVFARPLVFVMTKSSGSIYFSNERTAKPPPTYSVAEARRIQGDYQAAIEEYFAITVTHPEEHLAWIAMLEIAAANFRNTAMVQEVYNQAKAVLLDQKKLRLLDDAFTEAMKDVARYAPERHAPADS